LESIPVVSLDDLVARGELELTRLDVVKMDIEGAEPSALFGMRRTIARCRPEIVMEINPETLAVCGAAIGDVWNTLTALSYEVRAFQMWKERDPEPVTTLNQLASLCPYGAIDIVAVPVERCLGEQSTAS
jgi:hypothetical protein